MYASFYSIKRAGQSWLYLQCKTTLVSLKRRALFKDKSIKYYKFQSESIWNFSLPNNRLQLKIPLEKFKEDLMVKLLINRPP